MRGVRNLDIFSSEDLDFVKTETKKMALSSYGTYHNDVPQYLSNDEFIALQRISINKDFIIQKSDKGNSVVIVDRQENG